MSRWESLLISPSIKIWLKPYKGEIFLSAYIIGNRYILNEMFTGILVVKEN